MAHEAETAINVMLLEWVHGFCLALDGTFDVTKAVSPGPCIPWLLQSHLAQGMAAQLPLLLTRVEMCGSCPLEVVSS